MPLAVARITDHSVPMITTNSMAPSVWPNHRVASGTQHTLGEGLEPQGNEAQGILHELEAGTQHAQGNPHHQAYSIPHHQPLHSNP